MKKIILLTILLGFNLSMNAQKDTKPRLSTAKAQGKMESQVKICQLKAYPLEDGKVKILIDFGNSSQLSERQNEEIKSENYPELFSNLVDALRFMKMKGWQLIEDYEIMEEKGKVIYFILNRR